MERYIGYYQGALQTGTGFTKAGKPWTKFKVQFQHSPNEQPVQFTVWNQVPNFAANTLCEVKYEYKNFTAQDGQERKSKEVKAISPTQLVQGMVLGRQASAPQSQWPPQQQPWPQAQMPLGQTQLPPVASNPQPQYNPQGQVQMQQKPSNAVLQAPTLDKLQSYTAQYMGTFGADKMSRTHFALTYLVNEMPEFKVLIQALTGHYDKTITTTELATDEEELSDEVIVEDVK